MFGSKRLEAAYEKRISELKESHARELETLNARLADLHALALPQNNSTFHVPVMQAEADAILTPGVNDSIEMTPAQVTEWEEIHSEADRLFSGNY